MSKKKEAEEILDELLSDKYEKTIDSEGNIVYVLKK